MVNTHSTRAAIIVPASTLVTTLAPITEAQFGACLKLGADLDGENEGKNLLRLDPRYTKG